MVSLRTSPSFSHWMVGVGAPLALQTSWMLSFRRTPTSLGSSEPEILGGTRRGERQCATLGLIHWCVYVCTALLKLFRCSAKSGTQEVEQVVK